MERPGAHPRTSGTALGSAPFILSSLLIADAVVATVASLACAGLIHGAAASVGFLRGTALVILVGAAPVLALSMLAVRRGSLLAVIVWFGVLAYIANQGVLFLFGSPFNGLAPAFLEATG